MIHQSIQVNVLGDRRLWFLARCGQPLLIGLLGIVRKRWAPPNVPEPVLPPPHKQRPEFLLGLGSRLGLEWHPFDGLAPSVVLDGDPGHEFSIAPAKAANCVLAVIQNLGVFVSL